MRICRIIVVSLGLLGGLQAAAGSVPRPAGLEPEITFWRTVFTEVSSQQALIHDNRRLDIVYEKVELTDGSSGQQKRRTSENSRKKYRQILTTLAEGRRTGLTSEQRRVLTLWPEDVTAAELRAAAGRVRFQQGLSDRFRDGLIRAGRWREHILESLEAADVPPALASLPHVESSYNPAARSFVGASGLWQFTRSTGRRFMQIDHVIDERRDPYLSSEAAAQLLSYNYSILKSWPLAITAYNHGVAGMRRAVRQMGTDDIEEIIRKYDGRSFGFASRNFYVAFLAAHDVDQNVEKYFGPVTPEQPRADVVVALPDYMSAETLERAFGVSRDTMKSFNPALLASIWEGTKFVPRDFNLRLPAGAGGAPVGTILAEISDNRRFSAQTPDLQHKIERGESLSVIAARYGTSVSTLMALNNLQSRHRIRAGQVLNLPYRGPVTTAAIPKEAVTYTVLPGDTVGEIAHRAGMGESELLAMNSLRNKNSISPGQVLVLVSRPADSAEPVAASVSQPPAVVATVDRAPVAAPIDGLPVIIEQEQEADDSTAQEISGEMTPETRLLADPSDYFVADDNSIEVQAEETLGHYSDWLGIRTQVLRELNGLSFRQPVVIGNRLQLKFKNDNRDEFVAKRLEYHRELQAVFFSRYRITDTTIHTMRRGESLFVLTLRRYKVPVWLLRQYNPDIDLDRIRPGAEIVFPRIELANIGVDEQQSLADAS